MMKIILAKTAGFCMGVRRAVELVLEAPSRHKTPIYTYGPLIHNPQVLALLEEKGITVLKDIPDQGEGTVLIRAHGVPPDVKDNLKLAGFTVIDATCPRVIKVQTIIRKYARQGYDTIIIGDVDHPEVVGLLGYAGGKGHVVRSLDELIALPAFEQAILVAQTTQNVQFFGYIKQWVSEHYPHYTIFDTICDSTEKRQYEVKQLAESSDGIIVVGGRNSGNTQRLAEIAGQTGKISCHIETADELNLDLLANCRHVAITAGASTPNWVIKKVYRTLENFRYKGKKNWLSSIFRIQHILLLTNIYVSFGAGCLCFACAKLQQIPQFLPHALIAILYVQSMHILNNLTGTHEDQYNDPDRANFYNTNKFLLAMLAGIAGSACLMTAYSMGSLHFALLFIMSLLGLSYNMKWLPPRFTRQKFRSLREIPGSKTILIALAWGLVTSLFPALSEPDRFGLGTLLVFIWATSMVFVRTAFFDILDVQGDRIVGKETFPILMGEGNTLNLLKVMLVCLALMLAFSDKLGLISPPGMALAICPISMLGVLIAYQKGFMLPGIRLEFIVETHFVIAGIITLFTTIC